RCHYCCCVSRSRKIRRSVHAENRDRSKNASRYNWYGQSLPDGANLPAGKGESAMMLRLESLGRVFVPVSDANRQNESHDLQPGAWSRDREYSPADIDTEWLQYAP